MPVQNRLRPAALVLAVVLVPACGSTVQVNGSAVVGGGPNGELGGAGLGAPSQAGGAPLNGTGTTGAVTGTGGGAVTGPGGPSYAGTSGGTAGGGTSGGRASVQAPGVTPTTVYVGIIHDSSSDSVNQAAGVGAITHGDDVANAKAVIDDINKHGGAGGRKVVPVIAPFSSASTQTLDQQWSAVCQVFTKDRPVFASLESGSRPSYWECLHKAGVGIISSSLPVIGESTLAAYPGFIELGYPNVDRLARYTVDALAEKGFFTPWDTFLGRPATTGEIKVGVYTYDDKVFSAAVDRYLVPALKKRGYTPVVAKIAPLGGASDVGEQAAAVQSAQLTFATNRVTHVIPFESNGGLSTFFLPASRSQKYYPRYGISSASGFQALKDAGVADDAQFNGTVGYGWIPAIDLPRQLNPESAPWSNESRRHCLKVYRQHGITFDSGNAEAIGLATCATLYLLKAALDRAPKDVSLASFVRSAESLGTAYQPAGVVGVAFGPGRHDPANRVYDWRWYADCACFHYGGSPRTVP